MEEHKYIEKTYQEEEKQQKQQTISKKGKRKKRKKRHIVNFKFKGKNTKTQEKARIQKFPFYFL